MLSCITKTRIITIIKNCHPRISIEVKMKAKATQLAIIKDLEIEYEVLQERDKHLKAKKRRAGT